MITFFEVVSDSAPHIYHSALPLSPQSSVVYKLYKQYANPFMRVVQGLPISWGPIIATLHIDNPCTPIWSPCSRFIILPSNMTTDILDAVTLKKISTLDINENRSFCLTPDSYFLVERHTPPSAGCGALEDMLTCLIKQGGDWSGARQ